MSTKTKTGIVYSLAGAGMLAVMTGCSAAESGARSVSPTVAFGATASDVAPGSSGCIPEGLPRILATHVIPKPGIRATTDGAHIWLRFATRDLPRIAREIDSESLDWMDGDEPPTETAGSNAPAIRLPDDRRLVAWTEGSIERGMSVKVLLPRGDSLHFGYEGSAVGAPAVAVTSRGRAIVAFIESNGTGFHVVATRVVCSPE